MPSFHASARRSRSTSLSAIIARVLVLGGTLAVTIFFVPVLLGQQNWLWLTVLLVSAGAIFLLYSTRRFVPGKYLFPGTFFLVVFLITPIVLTVGYSFTNFGDGTRGTKEEAIASIVGNSVEQTEDSPRYALTIATTGSPIDGPFEFYLVDPGTGETFVGSLDQPLTPVAADEVSLVDGRVTEVEGATILSPREVNSAYEEIEQIAVQVDENSAIRALGVNQAFQGTTVLRYDEATDSITNTQTGEVFTVGRVGDSEYFVDQNGERAFSQSWLQNIGTANYERLFTNASIGGQFLTALGWTLVFAVGSMVLTFVVGLFLALSLNDDRLRGRRFFRSFLLLPYAVPGFIALLIWSNFYNRDFGLINDLLGTSLNWLGDPTLAKAAVLLTNLWMGFPYMFIVCTGALQAIPDEVKEAARIDGATALQTTIKIISPLLLVAVAPLLVANFAFNFNNFNAIELLTGGGPFPAGEYTRGATDILISMIYRIAFGGSGADFGFAAAVSVCLFVLTGVIAALQFRITRVLENVN
ncbi:MAG TPA: ABC transporter permease subunit [Jiangellaceae bacterium]|nr:ABC transporter permease subunit [Jiangellaceae bacterium]